MSAPPTDPLAALSAQVAQNVTVEGSAVQFINNLAAQLAAAGTNPTKLAAIVTALQTSQAALAADIAANTPAAPVTPPAGGAKKKP